MAYRPGDRALSTRSFEEIKVGDEAHVTHLLTQADVDAFAALTGDFNPLHVDHAFARRTLFRKPVVHGMLSASFISTLIGTALPGCGALWAAQTLDFLGPARVGDELRVLARVKQKSPAGRLLVLDVTITNQHGERLIAGEATVKVLEFQKEDSPVSDDPRKVILVTGGSRGIGAAVCRKLAAQGHRILVNYLRASDEAQRVAADIAREGGHGIAVQGDVSQKADVAAVLAVAEKEFGRISAMVHCAASRSRVRPFNELGWEAFQEQLDVQLKGAFHCVEAVLPKMLEAQAGSIVFVGSTAVDSLPPPQQSDYVVAKAALTALARSLAVEYGPAGIRVNVVAPGMTLTEMISELPEKAKLLTRMQTPLRRLGNPENVADAIMFLLSPQARHITGETIRVCGGAVMV